MNNQKYHAYFDIKLFFWTIYIFCTKWKFKSAIFSGMQLHYGLSIILNQYKWSDTRHCWIVFHILLSCIFLPYLHFRTTDFFNIFYSVIHYSFDIGFDIYTNLSLWQNFFYKTRCCIYWKSSYKHSYPHTHIGMPYVCYLNWFYR